MRVSNNSWLCAHILTEYRIAYLYEKYASTSETSCRNSTSLPSCKIVDAKGESYNQGELLRWLGESVLYPTNFLPSDRLEWIAIDTSKARINFKYKNLELFYIVTFNPEGEIIELETKRYMDKIRLETWIITIADYKQFDDMLIPTRFVVSWRLMEDDFSYAKFNITEIEYDTPHAFK